MLPTHDPTDLSRSSGAFGLVGVVEHPAGGGSDIVVDAELLFQGHYARAQSDLVVSDSHHRVVIHDYFDATTRPVLRSPDGALLPDALIASLVGAQEARVVAENAPEAPRAIGRVESASGGASALRNGVTVALHPGDPIFKGDVVRTDDGGQLGLIFVDGTAFNLDGESRMVVDGMNFQPGATGNNALFSLVQGIITFVAGQTAKSGDMKVATPSATMGIRGTAVHVEIASDHGAVKFSVMTEPDGHTGRYDVFDRDDPNHVLFTVSDPAMVTTVTPNGQGQIAINSAAKTAVETDHETGFLKGVFATVASGVQNPVVTAPSPTSTPTHTPAAGSSSPPNLVAPPTTTPLPAAPAPQGSPGDHSQAAPPTATPVLASADAQSARAQDAAVPTSVTTLQEATIHSTAAVVQVPMQSTPEPHASTHAGVPGAGNEAVGSSQIEPPAAVVPALERAPLAVPESQAVVQVRSVIQPLPVEAHTPSPGPTPSSNGDAVPSGAATSVVGSEPSDPSVTGSVPVGTAGGSGLGSSVPAPIPDHPLSVADVTGAVTAAARLSADTAHGLLANVPGASVASVGLVGGAIVAMASGSLTLAGQYGTLTVLGDGSYSYRADHAAALAAGGTGLDSFAYTARDPLEHTATSTLVLTVTGVNDAPVFDGVATPGASLSLKTPTGSGVEHASGSLHFTDPDLTDRPTASVLAQTISALDASGHALNLTAAQTAVLEHAFSIGASGPIANAGSVTWSYDLADAAFAFLGAGQTAVVTSTIGVDDHHGGVATQDVVIQLAGAAAPASPAPFALADIGGVAQGGAITVDAQHGVLANDTGNGSNASLHVISVASMNTGLAVPVTGPLAIPVVGDYGILTLSADGSYSYHAYSGALPSDTVAQDVFNYLVSDQQGRSSSASLTITVGNPSMTYVNATGMNDGPGQILSGSNGPTVLDGGNGDDHLTAGNGPTALIGGPGDDDMTGGAGPDTFVFSGQFGHDTVHGFDVVKDVLQFDHTVFNSVSAVLAAAHDGVGGVVITDLLGHSLTLLNVTKQALTAHAGDLHIV
ncbi:FecR family protein [Methylobacterium pseudosasicola]|uniref:FecR family protein n=1 Tax=Methylobacterium pseudosasicola TaxID=582667 RepID=A0A1I4RJS7_9HYPH|nr:FecR family protein [Methylobacterium pseudosasicola]